MRRILSISIIISAFAGLIFAQEAMDTRALLAENSGEAAVLQAARKESPAPKPAKSTKPRRRVDFMADDVLPYNRKGDSIVYFLGNFAAHHNGAVITCDSAVRYNDSRWGFFGDVIINQDSIYIYGDSAIYNGDISLAEVYAPIVKVIDGDALLYTYNFRFDTDKKVGTYTGGGVLVKDNDILESQRGYYYSDDHNIVCVDDVEIHGSDYDMKSDSVIYNTETKFARFFENSEIWNIDDEYLSADAGYYDNSQNLYVVTKNGYILTEEQEMWGDTLSYYRDNEHIIAYNNIQMDDIENKVLAFSDYAEYWGDKDIALLTRKPVTISYDTSEGDSVFMSADTMQFITISRLEEAREARRKEIADSLAKIAEAEADREALIERRQQYLEAKAARDARNRAIQDSLDALPKVEEVVAPAESEQTTTQEAAAATGAGQTKESAKTDTNVAAEKATTEVKSELAITNDTAEGTSAQEQATDADEQQSVATTDTTDNEGVEQADTDAKRTTSEDSQEVAASEVTTDDKASQEENATEEPNGKEGEENEEAQKDKKAEKAEKIKAEKPVNTKKLEKIRLAREKLIEKIKVFFFIAKANSASAATPADSLAMQLPTADTLATDQLATDSLAMDSLAADSVAIDPWEAKRLQLDSLTLKDLKRYAKYESQRFKYNEKKAKAIIRKQRLDSIGKLRRDKMAAQYAKFQEKELARLAKDSIRRANKRAKLLAKGRDVSALDSLDSLSMIEKQMLLAKSQRDSMFGTGLVEKEEFEQTDSLVTDSLATDSTEMDSLYRIVKAYRKVRIYRSDAQAICDSLASSSTDSIIHMYIEPVMWNSNNQIAAAQVDAYTKNQQLTKADFLENPIMVAEIDSSYYNQVTGKTMTAFFRDNEIYRNDVDGNVQTIYFQREDEESAIVTELVYLESASASFYIEDREVVGITYRNDVPFEFYPIALIPEDQIQRLPNFKWVPELRPTRENIFNKEIRPSKREERYSRQRPTFRIVESMDRFKERLLRQGRWVDREDELTPEIIEWRDSRERN